MRAALAVTELVLVACAHHEPPVCPASAEVASPDVLLQVTAWPDAAAVLLQCVPACGVTLSGADRTELTAQVVDGTAGFTVWADPATVVVTVLDAAGAELARLATELDHRQVGGTAECGGPMRAVLPVPAR